MSVATRTAKGYLADTEHAVRHIFEAIRYYESLLKGVIPPSQATSLSEVNRYMEFAKKYFGYSYSEATLCGSVFQVAFMGIYLFSRNTEVRSEYAHLVKPNHKAERFCIGRKVHNVPVGLIIYAGRNQFAHWEDESFDFPTSQVFSALLSAYYENPLFDMAYELNYPERTIKAHHLMLNELRWTSYDRYLADMEAMICA
jgi:hypothetical protein